MGRDLINVNEQDGTFIAASQMKAGDKVEGTIKSIEKSGNPQHKNAYFLGLETDGGEALRIFTSGTLSTTLSEGKVNVGEYIQIIADGKKKSKSTGNNYTSFTVLVDPATRVANESGTNEEAPAV